jgi:predicted pyridoxine 5'-phosphate oxidase superfamily flavin-nucleotide-binding protein
VLILMHSPNRRRLKISRPARIVDASDEPEAVNALVVPRYAARVERALFISVRAFDWNCPQHITPRFTEAEVEAAVAPVRAEVEALRAQLASRDRYTPM